MEKKTLKKRGALLCLLSGSLLSGCQAVDYFTDSQEPNYSYTTVKRHSNQAPTVIYQESDRNDSYRKNTAPSKPAYSGDNGYSSDKQDAVTKGTPSNRSKTNESVFDNQPVVPSTKGNLPKTLVPTEAPVVPNVGSTFSH